MATPCKNGTLPSAEASTSKASSSTPQTASSTSSTSQTASSTSQTASSTANGVIRGQKRKLDEDEQLSEVQRNPEYAHKSNRLNCQNSAGSSTACVSGPGISADGQAASYLNGASCVDLGREIQQVKDELVTYAHDLDPKIQLLNNSYAEIVREIENLTDFKDLKSQLSKQIIEILKSDTSLDAQELERNIKNETVMQDYFDRSNDRQIRELNAKKDVCACELQQQINLLNAKTVHADDLGKQSHLLDSNKNVHVYKVTVPQQLTDEQDPYVQDLHMKIQRLDDSYADAVSEIEYLSALKDSHDYNVTKLLKNLRADKDSDAHKLREIKHQTVMKDHYDRGLDCQIRELNSKKDKIACDLHKQIRLLNATNEHTDNLDNQSQLLNDNTDSNSDKLRDIRGLKDEQDPYAHDVYMKMQVLNDSYADAVREIEYLNVSKESHDDSVTALINDWKADKHLEAQESEREIKYQTVMKEDYDRDMDEQIKYMNDRKDRYAQELDKLLNAKNVHANHKCFVLLLTQV